MMTQEEVAQVIAYCEENKVSYKQRLDELGIAAWMFYDAKRKYASKQEADNAGEFLQLVGLSNKRIIPKGCNKIR